MWFSDKYVPGMAVQNKWLRDWETQIQDIKTEEKGSHIRPTIFATLLDSDLPPQDKSVARLVADAQNLHGAGSITTSTCLGQATYYIISDNQVFDKLISELVRVMPDASTTPSLTELEQLPYLSAVVLETLRITYGVSHRLQRVSIDDAFKYYDYDLPAGTSVSMTSVFTHDNASIFPDPREFRPERWLPLETTGAALQKYLVSFSRGSRQCLGMHLGLAEINIGLACVLKRFGDKMKVVDTIRERNLEMSHDFFTPVPSKE